jgi:DnaK suppressor protein
MSRSKPKSKKTGSKPARRPGAKAVAKPARKSAKRSARKPARIAASGSPKRSRTPRGARPARPARPAKPVKKPKAVAAEGRPKPERPAKVRVLPASPRVQKLRAMLEAKGAEIVEKIRRARAESLDADRTSFAEVGDLVSASVEKEKAFESGEAGVNAMREIAGALEKLKGGTYGICERCGKPIGLKRLEAMPSARLCVKCKAKEEAVGKIAAPSADNTFED